MSNAADLELSLRRSGEGYVVETRFRLTPTSPEVDLLAGLGALPLVQLDGAALLAQAQNPSAYGHTLATQLGQHTALRGAIQRARAQADAAGISLRLRLRLDPGDPGLHALRWELLGDLEQPEQPAALSERMLLSRFIASSDLSPVQPHPSRELSALIAVANPSDLAKRNLAPIPVDGEVERASTILEGAAIRILASDDTTVVSLATLAERLRDGPDIFYLVAHGALIRGAPHLWLQRDDGTGHAVNGADLVALLRNLPQRPTLTILASCESAGDGYDLLVALGPALVAAGLPAVIAMQGKVSMETIAAFTPQFLRELRRDGQIDRALAAARLAIKDRTDWWMPVLMMRLQNGMVWQAPGAEKYDVQGLDDPYQGLAAFTYADRDRFFGRAAAIAEVAERLSRPDGDLPLLFVTGVSGSGKSSFVQAGLVPELERRYAGPAAGVRRAVLRPGAAPLEALFTAFADLGLPPPPARAAVLERPAVLSEFLAANTPPGVLNLIVINRFEELFTQGAPEERAALLGWLAALPPVEELRTQLFTSIGSDQVGLVSELEQRYGGRAPALRRAVLRPGASPLNALFTAFATLGLAPPPARAAVLKRPAILSEFLAAGTLPGVLNLIVIDQFEELFTQSDTEERQAVFAWLAALPPVGQLRAQLIATIRSDFLPELFAHKALYDIAKVGVDLRVMREAELRETIERPIALTHPGKDIDPDLVAALAADAAQDSALLPLLQITLQDLWHRGSLTRGAYQSLGEVISRRADTIVRFCDHRAVYPREERPTGDQARMLGIFLDLVLVSLAAGQRDVRQRRGYAELVDDDPERARLIDELVESRLLMRSVEMRRPRGAPGATAEPAEEQPVDVVDIIHESLIANWGGLRSAISAQRATLRKRASFDLALAEWEQSGRADGCLLEGERLAAAESLAAIDDITLRGDVARALLELSQARRDEGLRRERERAAQLKHQLEEAHSLRLAFLAKGELETDPELALLLAYEAVALADHPIANDVLRTILSRTRPLLARFTHSGLINSVAFSPDGQRILTASDDKTARLWDVTGKQLVTLEGHTDAVKSAMFSPDGRYFLTSSRDGTTRLWNAAGETIVILNAWRAAFSPNGQHILALGKEQDAHVWGMEGQLLTTLAGHTSIIHQAVFSPHGEHILTVSADATARLWDLTGKHLATLEGHGSAVKRAVFSPDGERILTASSDTTARLWDASGNHLATFEGHTATVNSVAFSPDGRQLLTISDDKTVRLWDVSGKHLTSLQGRTDTINSAVFSPHGRYILTTSDDTIVQLWRSTGEYLATIYQGHAEKITCGVFSPDSSHILTTSGDTMAFLWDATNQPLPILEGHTDKIHQAAFSLDGSCILTASEDGTARLWDMTGQPLVTLDHLRLKSVVRAVFSPSIERAVFSPDRQHIFTIADDRKVWLWDVRGHPLGTIDTGTNPRIGFRGVVFSPDRRYFLSDSSGGTAQLWEVASQWVGGVRRRRYELEPEELWDPDLWEVVAEPLVTLKGHTGAILNAEFSSDGTRILTASQDGTARLWDVTGQPLVTFEGHTDSVDIAVFSPDGMRILTASQDGTARLWDVTGQILATLEGSLYEVSTAKFSPDGSHILIAWACEDVQLCDAMGQLLATLDNYTNDDRSAVFSPDGSRILATLESGTAGLWNAMGQHLTTLRGHTRNVTTMVFSPDGTRIVTTSDDGTARLHPVITEDLLAIAFCRATRGLTEAEIRQFSVPAPPRFSWKRADDSAGQLG